MISLKEKKLLSDLITIIKPLNLPIILVGAGARILMFDRTFGEGRSTKDWDIGVSIDNWDAYERLRANLSGGDLPLF